MPEMNGYEVCKYFKATESIADIPIVFLTVHADAESIAKAFDTGAIDYLTKPFKKAELLARVKVHLALRQAQEQLEDQNVRLLRLNDEKNEFLGIAAHDLKNPLNSIRGIAQMIRKRKDIELSDEEVNDMAHQIETSSNFMFEIITNLLDVNKIENGKLVIQSTSVDLMLSLSAVTDRYQAAAAKKNITLNVDIPDGDLQIYADPTLTIQVLDNIVSNAVKYSPHDKNIWVRASLHPEQKQVRVAVKDEGPGFSEDDKKKLFGKFARLSAKPTGGEHSTGLGLSIVKRLAEAMGATIWCESELGKGATFFIDFPDTSVMPEGEAQ
jgi:signal transduction histidine kinase